jgi:hypothetical protein
MVLNGLEKMMIYIGRLEEKIDYNQKLLMEKINSTEIQLSDSGKLVADEFAKVNDNVRASEKFITETVKNVSENGENTSWSDVVSKRTKQKAKKANPIVIVRPNNETKSRDDIYNSLKNIDSTKFEINGVNNVSKNGIAISCKDTNTQLDLLEELNNNLTCDFEAKLPEKFTPRLKILMVKDNDCENDEFTTTLIKQNNLLHAEAQIKVVKKESVFKNKSLVPNCFNYIIDVDKITHDKLINEGKIRFGWLICKVVENIHVIRCYKCMRYGHIADKCKNERTCAKCGENHETKNCTSQFNRCINCVSYNNKLNLNLNVDHNVWDKSCEVFKRRFEMCKKALNYVQ